MTTIAQPHGDPVLGTPSKLRVAIGSAVGTTVENYDFIGYGTAAALYFGTAFFPSADPVTGTLLSFATLGIGFAARPLGGIIGAMRCSLSGVPASAWTRVSLAPGDTQFTRTPSLANSLLSPYVE